jgi:hypothetical protein
MRAESENVIVLFQLSCDGSSVFGNGTTEGLTLSSQPTKHNDAIVNDEMMK